MAGLIAVQFWYEYQDKEDAMKWKRCYGLEDWTFDEKVIFDVLFVLVFANEL